MKQNVLRIRAEFLTPEFSITELNDDLRNEILGRKRKIKTSVKKIQPE
jgi:hypothetical protein